MNIHYLTEQLAKIDYWGGRGWGPAQDTAKRMVAWMQDNGLLRHVHGADGPQVLPQPAVAADGLSWTPVGADENYKGLRMIDVKALSGVDGDTFDPVNLLGINFQDVDGTWHYFFTDPRNIERIISDLHHAQERMDAIDKEQSNG